ncbi:MAG: EamA family transporter [Actinomycetota bacterium]|jgi:transporter family protein|nr:EamA family transporter [Actinomycetota bacterium]
MDIKVSPYLLAIISMFFWGMAPIFGKLGLEKTNPYIAFAIRCFVIAAIMLIVILIKGDFRELAKVDLKSFAFISLEGIFATLIGHFAYYYALKIGETSKVVPITSAFPLITVVISIMFLSEKLTLYKGSGIILIIAGVLLLRL